MIRELHLYYAPSSPLIGEYEGVEVAIPTEAWRYDDAEHKRVGEPFVMGASEMIDVLRRLHGLPQERLPFTLIFSDESFAGAERADHVEKDWTGVGDWYHYQGQVFWLCPALLDFFDRPPTNIWVKAVV